MPQPGEVIQAVQKGDMESLRAMLAESQGLATARDANGVSAVMHALYRGRRDMAELLLAAHPGPDIFEATGAGNLVQVTELLGADPGLAKSWSADGFTALHFAAFFGQEQVAEILLQYGADPATQARNPMKVMPLHSAAAAHKVGIVRSLLEHGAPANARQEQGWTALHEAAQNGDRAMVEILLKHGADPSLANDAGTKAIDLATTKGHAEVAKLLQGPRV